MESSKLEAQLEPFDSFWEGPEDPEDIEKGYGKFGAFYTDNYLKKLPADKAAKILVISCGAGYFVKLLKDKGYSDVVGIDSGEEKISEALKRDLNCKQERAFEYLQAASDNTYDVIFCEQELNHLTKKEMVYFVRLCVSKLKPGGRMISHGLNGANPITGAEALAQNFDHFNTFTAYTFDQVLSSNGLEKVEVFPLNLYVFWKNPANYILLGFTKVLHLCFRLMFIIYGKHNKLWTKKIAAIGYKPQ